MSTQGYRHSEATKQKMREARLRNVQIEHESKVAEPEYKQCSRCKKYKKRWRDFSTVNKKLYDGSTGLYPSSRCKKCLSEIAAERREKMRREGTYTQFNRKWYLNRKARYKKLKKKHLGEMVDVWNLVAWIDYDDYYRLSKEHRGTLAFVCGHQKGRITLRIVDEVLTAIGRPDMLHELYPYDK